MSTLTKIKFLPQIFFPAVIGDCSWQMHQRCSFR